jgi:hypothetical protein
MAKCDQGYLCEVCQQPVQGIIKSSLYLRFIIGEVEAAELLSTPERHLTCDPLLTQYIVDPGFPPVTCEGFFDKHQLDATFVKDREALVTAGWQRLKKVVAESIPIPEYPLQK